MTLTNFYVPEFSGDTSGLSTLTLTPRQLCDLELILNGGFAPLTGFLNEAEYTSVVETMRLSDGSVWPMPITLDVATEKAASCEIGSKILLQDQEGFALAVLTIESKWTPDKNTEADNVFGTTDPKHPAVSYLMTQTKNVYVGGSLEAIALPRHYSFPELRRTPAELKAEIAKRNAKKVTAFQTRNPMHRAHVELTLQAMQDPDSLILIHPVVGMTKPGDVDYYTRVKCYEQVMTHYPEGRALLSLLPLAMRMAGPREALWHALIRKNYGCTHFIVGRDHAGPGNDSNGNPFYGPYDAQELVTQYADEIGIEMVPFQEMVYVQQKDAYLTRDQIEERDTVAQVSGTQFRQMLADNSEIPSWFSYPEVIAELRKAYKPADQRGIVLFFTGLSGAGKSTTANALLDVLMAKTSRTVSLFDGDHVRQMLSSELGFSKAHRDLNILRIGYVASEVAKAGGIAICAPIAPYADTRARVRQMTSQSGAHFVEVYVATSLDVCEERDAKGLYKKARAGIIKEFTGISDPYEAPETPEITIDTNGKTVKNCVTEVLDYLTAQGYLHIDKILSSSPLDSAPNPSLRNAA